MRAYIHAFQGNPWNEECQAAYDGFTSLGIDCILFHNNAELEGRSNEDVVVGGMLVMEHCLNELGIQPEDYNYPEVLQEFLGRKVWQTERKNLKQEKLPVFIKPFQEKAAKGMVVYSWDDIRDYEHLEPDAVILCSEAVSFVSEWRCFVRYGEIVGIQFYNGDNNIVCDRAVVEAAVGAYQDIPAGCSLDFGVTDDGRTLLIEMNDGLAIGCYGLPNELYAKLLTARWAELTGTQDIFY